MLTGVIETTEWEERPKNWCAPMVADAHNDILYENLRGSSLVIIAFKMLASLIFCWFSSVNIKPIFDPGKDALITSFL